MEGRAASCLRIPGSTEGHPRLEPLYLLLQSQLTWWSGQERARKQVSMLGWKWVRRCDPSQDQRLPPCRLGLQEAAAQGRSPADPAAPRCLQRHGHPAQRL